jgi:hypothetical protein
MRRRIVTLGAIAALAAGLAAPLAGCGDDRKTTAHEVLGAPTVTIVSPRNGARQTSRSVVVKAKVRNFRLAPARFGEEPRLAEGHLRFALNRVPDCVDPAKLQRAKESPVGRGRLVGASFDFPRHSGPNGLLAKRIGSIGSYSPATRPEIYYDELPAGFYRLVLTLAENNGLPTPHHAVANFQILSPPGHETPQCTGGKVTSAKAKIFE